MGIKLFDGLPIGWVDFLVVIMLLVGVSRGKKRGMSEELLDLVKWLLIVVCAAYIYEPLGQVVAQNTPFSDHFAYVSVYCLTIIAFIAFFSFIRPRLGDKIVDSDFFGSCEFVFGMVAGAARYACIILVLLALLNSRQYTAQEIRDENAFQEQNFGSIRFPTPMSLHMAIFDKSLTGSAAKTYLTPLLIKPTVPEDKALGRHSIVRARERQVNEVLDKR
jgi:uncharacterized membrane protein required for colicin V production